MINRKIFLRYSSFELIRKYPAKAIGKNRNKNNAEAKIMGELRIMNYGRERCELSIVDYELRCLNPFKSL
jgi:hypothetical protein